MFPLASADAATAVWREKNGEEGDGRRRGTDTHSHTCLACVFMIQGLDSVSSSSLGFGAWNT